MPDLATAFAFVLSAGRIAVFVYAAVATTFTTACLTLHAVTLLDRRGRGTATAGASRARRPARSPFISLGADLE
jgi:hypothetical protein